MRWYRADVYAMKRTGVDELGKAVCEPALASTVFVRPSPWGIKSAGDNEGNSYDYVRRTFFTKADRALLAGAAYLEVLGERYTVREVSRALEMTVVVAERYKVRA